MSASINETGDLDSGSLTHIPEITLPSIVRYYDNFALEHRSIRNLAEEDVWSLKLDGSSARFDFTRAPRSFRPILKRWVIDVLPDRSAHTAYHYSSSVLSMGVDLMVRVLRHLLEDSPGEFRSWWLNDLRPLIDGHRVRALRSLCRTFCRHGLGQWTPDYLHFISTLKGHTTDKYAAIKRGDCFVDLHDQSRIVQYLDDIASMAKAAPARVPINDLRGAIIVLLGFQHGLRPGQIARIKSDDLTFHDSGAVHIRFPITKQRRDSSAQLRLRSIRREWGPIFAAYVNHPSRPAGASKLLCNRVDQVEAGFKRALAPVTETSRSLTDLRHSAAQRLVDSGASHSVITEFMCHADLGTALVYIQGSPTQAERINRALGLSDIFSVVAEAARTGVINRKDLDDLPEDQVVAGMPHGIPISGIGACRAGQGLCSRNPVTSCYTCHKFMAVSDVGIHESVASDLRDVVKQFAEMARPGETSPAMAQLRATLEAVQSLIDQLTEGAVK